MSDSDDIAADIATAATEPVSASIDGNSATRRSIGEQIEAARFLAAREMVARDYFGLQAHKYKPPRPID